MLSLSLSIFELDLLAAPTPPICSGGVVGSSGWRRVDEDELVTVADRLQLYRLQSWPGFGVLSADFEVVVEVGWVLDVDVDGGCFDPTADTDTGGRARKGV